MPRTPPPTKKPKYDKDTFISAAVAVHGLRYDYSEMTDVRLNKKLTFICAEHGEFEQYGTHHLAGRGCKKCGIARRSFGGTSHELTERVQRIIKAGGRPLKRERVGLDCVEHGPYVVSEITFEKSTPRCPVCLEQERTAVTTDKRSYYQAVRTVTERHWRERPGWIDPYFEEKPRGRDTYHIDHIFTIYDGYRLQADPNLVGHWCNLMLVPAVVNIRRGKKHLRSLETLLSVYENYKHLDLKWPTISSS